jgi:hypothetical protein
MIEDATTLIQYKLAKLETSQKNQLVEDMSLLSQICIREPRLPCGDLSDHWLFASILPVRHLSLR